MPNTREDFKASWIFVLAAVGSAAGLGNVWRFPYLAYEFGGASFFIAYFISLFIIGLPFLISEIGIGQIFKKSAPFALKKVTKYGKASIIGWFAVLVSLLILTYYVVITSWTLFYAKSALSLSWENNSTDFFHSFLGLTENINQSGNFNTFMILAILGICIFAFIMMYKGTKGITAVAIFITPLPFIFLIYFLFNTIFLEGAISGLKAYIVPNFEVLSTSRIWFAAVSQALFSLSIAYGVMFAYGAILKKDVNVKKVAIAIIFGDTFIALIAGCIIFGVIGHMAYIQNISIHDVFEGGIELAFIILPQGISYLPFGAPVFALLFYISLFFLAFTSIVSLIESIVAAIMDSSFKIKRYAILIVVLSFIFLGSFIYTSGNGLYNLDIVDHFVGGYGLLFVALLEIIAIAWFYDAEKLRYNLKKQSNVNLSILFNILTRFIIPILLIILIIRQISDDLYVRYGGFPLDKILTYGVGSLVILVFGGLICNVVFRNSND